MTPAFHLDPLRSNLHSRVRHSPVSPFAYVSSLSGLLHDSSSFDASSRLFLPEASSSPSVRDAASRYSPVVGHGALLASSPWPCSQPTL